MPVSIHAPWRWLVFVAVLLIMFSAPSIASDIQTFSLDAGDADRTLKQFAKQSGLSIVYDPASIVGVQTKEVVGMFSPRDALEQMLMGTPLVSKQDLETGAIAVTRLEEPIDKRTTKKTELENKEGKGMDSPQKHLFRRLAAAVALGIIGGQGQTAVQAQDQAQAKEEEEIFTLGEFEVPAEAMRGWVSPYSTAATKAATKLVDVPQPVNIITRELLEDAGSIDELDIVGKVTPGVTLRNNANLDITIRGFRALQSSIDGVVQRGVYNYPSILFERLEIVKGPASLLYGSFAAAGGYANRITKDPEHEFGGFFQGTIGTSDLYSAGVDVTGPIAFFDNNVQYRVIAEIVDRNMPGYEGAYDNHHMLAFEFGFDLGKTNRLLIGYTYVDRNMLNDRGIIDPSTATEGTVENPGKAGVPLRGFTTAIAFAEFDEFPARYQTQIGRLDIKYTSNPFPGFSYRTNFVWESHSSSSNLFSGTGNTLSDVYPVSFSGNDGDFEELNGLIDGTWTYKPNDNFSNRVTVGAEVSYRNGTNTRASGGGSTVDPIVPIDVNNLQAYLDQPLPVPYWKDTGESDQLVGGFYSMDRLSFWQDRLQINGAIRYNWIGAARLFIPTTDTGIKGNYLFDANGDPIPDFDYDQYQRHFEKTSYVSTPYGFVVKPIEQLSFFYGFTDAFRSNGSSVLTFERETVPPETSEGTEYGVKFDFFRGLSGTISVFSLDVVNRITNDPVNSGYKIVLPPLHNEGWEMSLNFAWRNLSLMAGYYSGDLRDQATGIRPDNSINETLNLAARYQVTEGGLKGLSFGGIYNKVGSTPVNGRTEILGSYETVDVFLGYRWGDWKFQVNGRNIFDENYTPNYIRPSLVIVAPGESWQFSVTRYFGSRSAK